MADLDITNAGTSYPTVTNISPNTTGVWQTIPNATGTVNAISSGTYITNSPPTIVMDSGGVVTNTQGGTSPSGTYIIKNPTQSVTLNLTDLHNCFLKTTGDGTVICGEPPTSYTYIQPEVKTAPPPSHEGGGAVTAWLLVVVMLGLVGAAAYRSGKMITINGTELRVNFKWTRKQMIKYSLIAYAAVALITYGSWSGYYVRVAKECLQTNSQEKCDKEWGLAYTPAPLFVPIFAGFGWPLYFPLHIATKLFE